MFIDLYGLLPLSRTAVAADHQPRPRTNSFPSLQFALLLIVAFPVMVQSIEPVPLSKWSLAIDPSYVSPSTSALDDSGSGLEPSASFPTSSSRHAGWYPVSVSPRNHSSTIRNQPNSNGAGSQSSSRHRHRIKGSADRQGGTASQDGHHGRRSETDDHDSEFLPESPPAAAVVRWYRLYNRCSGGYLQMYMNDVNARGKSASPLAQLRVVIDSYGSRIRIQSQKFGKYLCFNRRQRITSKYNGRSERCVFIEKISDNHYTELESAWRPGLYLGFNRGDGKFLDPSRYYTDRRTCFQFVKNSNTSYGDVLSAGGEAVQQNDGPTDFSRLTPEGQRWLRTRMHQENDGSGDGELEDLERIPHGRRHRLRHGRSRLRHYRNHNKH